MSGEAGSSVGAGAFDELPQVLARLGAKRIMLVSGGRSYTLSGAEGRLERLLDPGMSLRRFHDFQRNPSVEDVARGIAWLRRDPGDVLLAIGGGSVIDIAKAINGLSTLSLSPRCALRDSVQPTEVAVPMIAVPTTAGTGSETTRFAAVYVDGVKHSLDAPCLLPRVALVDPELGRSVPPALAACVGLDALCQAIESYWAVGATATSREHASGAIERLLGHLPKVVTGARDDGSLAAMAEGAFEAGKAIDVSRTTAAHALSYPLTTHVGIPHGHAVALTLPYFMRLVGDIDQAPLSEAVDRAGLERVLHSLWAQLGCDSARDAAACIESLTDALKLPRTFALAQLDEGCVERMVQEINVQRLANFPVRIDAGQVREAYRQLMAT